MAMVYTAIVGDRARTDIKCFTGDGIFQRPVMEAKRYKVLPHLFFPTESVTVWIDGNVWLNAPEEEIVSAFLGPDDDMALFRHSYRKTVWEEFEALRKDQRFAIPYLQQQLIAQKKTYRDAGLPDDAPLFECNFLIRRNNDRVRLLMQSWWSQITRWQWRDQVSLPFVLWQSDVRVNAVTANIRDHPLFRYVSKY